LDFDQLLALGILGSFLVGIGEYLLHFLPDGPPGEISMLEQVPLDRASKGHFFSVVGLPLYFAGYYGLKEFIVGGIWISSRYFGAEVLQRSKGTPDYTFYLQSYEDHYQILVWALRIIVAALSIVYVVLILKNKQGLPKLLTFFNPIVLLIIIISSLFWFKPLGVHIAPIAMNVTHFIFFSVMLWALNRQSNFQ